MQSTDTSTDEFAASFTSFGVPFRLTTNDSSLLEEMCREVPYQSTKTPDDNTAATFQLLFENNSYNLQTATGSTMVEVHRSSALQQLRQDLMVHVAEHAPDYVFVHAGVVGVRDRVLVFPGRSHAGKTTLIAELVKAGATYFSDEYAVVDGDGHVHPYARELQMREPGKPEQRPVSVELLGGTSSSKALPVAQVLFVQYVPGSTWTPEPITSGMAVLEMLRHSIPVQRTPARVMAVLTRILANASAYRSERGEAGEAAQAILAMANGIDGSRSAT